MVLDGGWGWYWRVVGGGIGEQVYLEFHEICEGVCGIYLYMRMYIQKVRTGYKGDANSIGLE